MFDWARPFVGSLPARTAVAAALLRRIRGPRPKIQAVPGGWLVSAPTGAQTSCTSLTALVAATRTWTGGTAGFDIAYRGSGRLVVPEPDLRRGLELRVSASAPRTLAWPPRPGASARPIFVADAEAALVILHRLATMPWSLRYYLAAVHGVRASWGGEPDQVRAPTAEHGTDLLVWAEHARQAGALDERVVALRCPLSSAPELDVELDVEIRAGQVTRARTVVSLP